MQSLLLIGLLTGLSPAMASTDPNDRDCRPGLEAFDFEAVARAADAKRMEASRRLVEMFAALVRPPPPERVRDFSPLDRDHCFTANMRVSTPRGSVAISRLRPGDPVFSYDFESRSIVVSAVTAIVETPDRAYGRLVDLPAPIEVTDGHRFYAEARGFRALRDLAPENHFLCLQSAHARDPRTADLIFQPRGCYVPAADSASVFELSLGPGPHNYFVEGILVHNVKEIGI